jgi:dTDP-4-dehydrorhamnose reductase
MSLALVLGRGTLGLELVRALERIPGWRVVGFGRNELDITTDRACIFDVLFGALKSHLTESFPRVVVFNTAAFTGVDAAESQQRVAYRVNALGAENVATAVAQMQRYCQNYPDRFPVMLSYGGSYGAAPPIQLVHVSTDAVFVDADGKSELDQPLAQPRSVYGASKLTGERLVMQVAAGGLETYLVRTANLYGQSGHNWASSLRASLLKDESVTADVSRQIVPTWAGWAARAMVELLDHPRGTYHLCAAADESGTHWLEFAREMARRLGHEAKIQKIRLADRRAADLGTSGYLRSVMLPLRGIALPGWEAQLGQYLESMGDRVPDAESMPSV